VEKVVENQTKDIENLFNEIVAGNFSNLFYNIDTHV
jgi:hypothetical protein